MSELFNTEVKNIIWSSDFDLDDFLENIRDEHPGLKDDEAYIYASEINDGYLDDEKANISTTLNESILIIGVLGRWDGIIPQAYRETDWSNPADCLTFEKDMDGGTWFISKDHELCSRQYNHDASSVFLYRVWRENAEKDILLDKIYAGKATMEDISRYTLSLGKRIEHIYGWN